MLRDFHGCNLPLVTGIGLGVLAFVLILKCPHLTLLDFHNLKREGLFECIVGMALAAGCKYRLKVRVV